MYVSYLFWTLSEKVWWNHYPSALTYFGEKSTTIYKYYIEEKIKRNRAKEQQWRETMAIHETTMKHENFLWNRGKLNYWLFEKGNIVLSTIRHRTVRTELTFFFKRKQLKIYLTKLRGFEFTNKRC